MNPILEAADNLSRVRALRPAPRIHEFVINLCRHEVALARLANAETEYHRRIWLGGGIRGKDWVSYEARAEWTDRHGKKRSIELVMHKPPRWLWRDVVRFPDNYAQEITYKAIQLKQDGKLPECVEHFRFDMLACYIEMVTTLEL